jgi:periodic tryptophan protein 1
LKKPRAIWTLPRKDQDGETMEDQKEETQDAMDDDSEEKKGKTSFNK